MGFGFLELAEDASATIRNIVDLYDKLLTEKPDTPLLSQVAQPRKTKAGRDPQIEREFSRRLGHSNPHFPLSEHQQQVLTYLDVSAAGEVIAVNGPPGTGKTTMLLSAVASCLIRAALKGEDPPVIVAASTNNQAVTNIIDAFGKDFAHGEGPFAGRWLPDIESFGIFLASHSRKFEAAKKYQTEDFQTACESVEYLWRAKEAYLQAAQVAFPSLSETRVEPFVAAIQKEMAQEFAKLAELDRAAQRLGEAQKAIEAFLGENPDEAEEGLLKTADEKQRDETRLKAAKTSLEAHLAAESTISALFNFLPAIKKKRVLLARQAVHEFMSGLDRFNRVADIESHVADSLRSAEQARRQAEQELEKARQLRGSLADAEGVWEKAKCALGDAVNNSDLERAADLGIRFKLFLLATHY